MRERNDNVSIFKQNAFSLSGGSPGPRSNEFCPIFSYSYLQSTKPRILWRMAKLIKGPTVVQAAGNKPKQIQEFIGRINSETSALSIARMVSLPGWEEPGQTPEFDEFTIVLRGALRVETRDATFDVLAGQGIHVHRGEWVRYSTLGPEGAEYVAVCLPAFSPDTVHRDA